MENVPAEFLEDAINDLSEILGELDLGASTLSPQFSQKIFRRLHTVKGSAQTFGLEREAKLAHLTETLLTTLNDAKSENAFLLLAESLAALKENFSLHLQSKEPLSLQGIMDKIAAVLPMSAPAVEIADEKPQGFPEEFLERLSPSEIESLASAWGDGSEILILQFAAAQSEFASRFRQLKESLGQANVIAVASGQPIANTMLLRFLLATEKSEELVPVLKEHGGKVLYQRRKNDVFDDGLKDETRLLIVYGKKAAQMLGKKVRFLVSKDSLEIPAEFSALAAIVFQHLLRNAVDHGIEFPLERRALGKPPHGTVEISVTKNDDELVLSVCDDGRGMESAGEIFDSGYTTAPFVSEVSGRGVGLDAVRDAVHAAGGIIKVDSKPGHGARFEVDLPLNERR
jgi:two-component system, chemotaxis family, sensor kinase CheA